MKTVYSISTAVYSRYIDSMRGIPIAEDCLKPIEKRILWAAYLVTSKSTPQKFYKSLKIMGDTNAYHPHGDLSIYDTLARVVRLGVLFDKQGSFGSPGLGRNEDDKAGARYTELRLKPEIYDQIAEIESELLKAKIEGDEIEPLFIPSIIPFGLIGDNVIIGIGIIATRFPRFKREDLLIRLKWLLGDKLEEDKPTIKPNFLTATIIDEHLKVGSPSLSKPDPSINNFEELLTKGRATFRVNVPVKLVNNDRTLQILGRHPVLKTGPIEKYIEKYAKQNEGELPFRIEDMCETLDDGTTNVGFIIRHVNKRQQISTDTVNLIKKLLNTKITFTVNVTKFDSHAARSNSDELLFTNPQLGIDQLLLESFTEWTDILNRKFTANLVQYKIQYRNIEVLSYIRSILERKSDIRNTDAIIAFMKTDTENKSNITEEEIDKTCKNSSIHKLLNSRISNSSKSGSNSPLKPIQDKIDRVNGILNNWKTYCLDRVLDEIKK